MKHKALVCGAGGFIGSHLVKRLRQDGFWVRGIDLKYPEFADSQADDFIIGDLRDPGVCRRAVGGRFEQVYQLAADMGGAGFAFTGENDASIMHNSTLINLNMLESCRQHKAGTIFYSSSACIYPEHNQMDPDNPKCSEDSAYPAAPDSEYGWEKLFGERLYFAYGRNYDMNVKVARLHNVFGPEGTWHGGREKAPAALIRKTVLAHDGGEIELWGDGRQTRSFLYIDDCVDGIRRLMNSEFGGPVNIGSEEMVSINQLAKTIIDIAGKDLSLRHVKGPEGVRGRTSNNTLVSKMINWHPTRSLREGLENTHAWIAEQVEATRKVIG